MSRTVLSIVGVLWMLFGLACLVAPSGMIAVTGIDLTSGQSTAEVRAMYGGAELGFGAFLLYASRSASLVRPALLALAMVMAGFALGRVSGVMIDGALDGVTLGSLATEVAIFALAMFALRRAPVALAAGAI